MCACIEGGWCVMRGPIIWSWRVVDASALLQHLEILVGQHVFLGVHQFDSLLQRRRCVQIALGQSAPLHRNQVVSILEV